MCKCSEYEEVVPLKQLEEVVSKYSTGNSDISQLLDNLKSIIEENKDNLFTKVRKKLTQTGYSYTLGLDKFGVYLNFKVVDYTKEHLFHYEEDEYKIYAYQEELLRELLNHLNEGMVNFGDAFRENYHKNKVF